jgi:hypothetical protein
MPHNARWPIAALLGLLREEGVRQPQRRFFIEYVLLAGVNDEDDARRLTSLLRGINAQVNGPQGDRPPRVRGGLSPHGALIRWSGQNDRGGQARRGGRTEPMGHLTDGRAAGPVLG